MPEESSTIEKYKISLPPGVVTFDAQDFGGYCPRGYNPSATSGVMRGVEIRWLLEGRWLEKKHAVGSSGTLFTFRDKDGKSLGTAWKPSLGVGERFHTLIIRNAANQLKDT